MAMIRTRSASRLNQSRSGSSEPPSEGSSDTSDSRHARIRHSAAQARHAAMHSTQHACSGNFAHVSAQA
jgi:hypothetical protein